MRKILKVDFVRFCIVGGIGFLVNFLLLTLLYKILSIPLFIAQLISAEIALFGNFLLHHNWTYKEKRSAKTVKTLLIQFHASSWAAILGTAIIVSVCVNHFKMDYIVALALAGVAALFWNFVWSKYVIWRDHKLVVDGDVTPQ